MTGSAFKALANKIPNDAEVVFGDGSCEVEISQEDGVFYVDEGEEIDAPELDIDDDEDDEDEDEDEEG